MFQKKHERSWKLLSTTHASGAPTDKHHLCALLITVKNVFLLSDSIVLYFMFFCIQLETSTEFQYNSNISTNYIESRKKHTGNREEITYFLNEDWNHASV